MKKGQIWGMDIMIAVSIFLVALIVFLIYSLNQTTEAVEIIKDLEYNGKIISESLLSEGYPESWDNTNVVRIGLITNNQLSTAM